MKHPCCTLRKSCSTWARRSDFADHDTCALLAQPTCWHGTTALLLKHTHACCECGVLARSCVVSWSAVMTVM